MDRKTKERNFQKCWEFINCPIEYRKNCFVYKNNLGEGYWLVTNNNEKENYAFKEYSGCKKCPWYMHRNS